MSKQIIKNLCFVFSIAILAITFGVTVFAPSVALAYNGYPPYSYGADYYSYPQPYYAPAPVPVPAPQPISVPVYIPVPVQVQVPVQVPVYVPAPVYAPLSVSCSASVNNAVPGQSVIWNAYVSGGSGSYSFNWFGSENISGNNQSTSVTYFTPGQKLASVTVYSSNGQSRTEQCNNAVNVAQPVPVFVPVPTPIYVQQPVYSGPDLDIGCFADPTNGKTNQPVTWRAEVTGGIAPYRYTWSGTDNLTGSEKSIIKYYFTAGEKYAVVTVRSADGRSETHACSNSVTIKKPTTTVAAAKPAVKPAPAKPVTTTCCAQTVCCNQSFGQNSQTYSYGSNTNNNSTNGNIAQNTNSAQQNAPVVNVTPNPYTQTANPYFNLANVPWGWVAVLVIFVLFATVIYLLFNRTKI